MNARSLALLSLALNVALLVGLWRGSPPPPSAPAADETATGTAGQSWVKTNVTRVEITRTNEAPPFHWEQVQSETLTNYVAGLRAIECPEETILDIIRGELTERYLARRRLVLDPWQRQYWDLAVHGLGQAKEQFSQELEKLKQDTLERLDGLMGGTKPAPKVVPEPTDSRLQFLSEEKQQQLAALDKKFGELEQALPRERGSTSEARKAQMKALKDQRLEAVRALLTPEELEEYRLRTSRHASVAQSAVGFDASEDEMRKVTRIYEQFDEALLPLDRKDPAYATKDAARKEAQRQRDEALKSELGDARFQELRRGENGSFRQIHQVAERYELATDVAVQVDDLRRVAQEKFRQVQQNKALSAEQRAELLRAIRQESRVAVGQAFGEEAARTYERNGGEWLREKP